MNNNNSLIISENQINKIIQDLSSYFNDNSINLSFSNEFKDNKIMQIYANGWS